ncbi:MAG: copper chaperone PCu(A)C [Luminiphilus sp.]|jgi:periplasmic copper chaperone A|nr:copper chaperone PCu(A)C [Luminiphilus sp.]
MKYTVCQSLFAVFLAGFMPITQAEETLRWEGAWVRSVPPGASVAAAYGKLVNDSMRAFTVTGVTSALSADAQMHDVIAEGDQRRMVPLDSVTVPPGASMAFVPGGRHIMLMGFDEPPREGAAVQLCAIASSRDPVCTEARVQRQAPMSHVDYSGDHH